MDSGGRGSITGKMQVFLRLLGSGLSIDDEDYSSKMGRESLRSYFKKFWEYKSIVHGYTYLNQRPTLGELGMIEQKNASLGFLGCIGSVYCTSDCHFGSGCGRPLCIGKIAAPTL